VSEFLAQLAVQLSDYWRMRSCKAIQTLRPSMHRFFASYGISTDAVVPQASPVAGYGRSGTVSA
jgi:hypothetical protein